MPAHCARLHNEKRSAHARPGAHNTLFRGDPAAAAVARSCAPNVAAQVGIIRYIYRDVYIIYA